MYSFCISGDANKRQTINKVILTKWANMKTDCIKDLNRLTWEKKQKKLLTHIVALTSITTMTWRNNNQFLLLDQGDTYRILIGWNIYSSPDWRKFYKEVPWLVNMKTNQSTRETRRTYDYKQEDDILRLLW